MQHQGTVLPVLFVCLKVICHLPCPLLLHICEFIFALQRKCVCVFINVRACVRAPQQVILSLRPGCGHAWRSHRGVFINEEPPALPTSTPRLLTASCHNHQMPLPPATPQTHALPHHHPPPVPGCGGCQRGIVSHRGGAMLLRPLL